MKHAKQILSLGMALALAIPVPVLAEDATINSNTTQDVKVTATVGSSFEVTIPKEITLTSDKTGTGTYTGSIPVTVKGDIGTNQLITVDTNDSVSLADSTGASTEAITATITKDETEFDFDDLTGGKTASASHSISAELMPGTWEGKATFYINLKDAQHEQQAQQAGLYDAKGVMLASWEETGIDIEKDFNYGDYSSATNTANYIITNNYPNTTKVILPDGAEHIGKLTFAGCKIITDIIIPETVTSIGDEAFAGCSNLANIEIPERLTEFGLTVFSGTAWEASQRSLNRLVIVNDVLIDGETASGSVTVPSNVKCIAPGAFKYNESLTAITITGNVKEIRNNVFQDCTNLKTVTLEEGVELIGGVAFSNTIITSINLPSTITKLESNAFNNCPKLTSIKWNGTAYTNQYQFNTAVRDAGIAKAGVWN